MPGAWLLDLDGVLWRGARPIDGSAEAVNRLRAAGVPVAFFTNNSFPTVAGHLAKLAAMGVEASERELLTSAEAAAALVGRGDRVLAVGGEGVLEALGAAGAVAVPVARFTEGAAATAAEAVERADAFEPPAFDAVVVGIDPEFDFARLSVAMRCLRKGAAFIATNDDATYPTAHGLVPGAGAVVAAIERASGMSPVVAGKPSPASAKLVSSRLGQVAVVVGDRPETDGLLARRLGARFALVTSGVTPPDHGRLEPEPDDEAFSFEALVEAELAR